MTEGTRTKPAIVNVIDRGFCIGCGACTALDPGFRLADTNNGFIEVVARPSEEVRLQAASRICPMGDAPDEDDLAAALFPGAEHYCEGVGRYHALFAGWSEAHRSAAGSGGVTRWLLARALRTKYVDFVVTVDRKTNSSDPSSELFRFSICENAEELLENVSSSAYYPVTLAEVLRQIRDRPGRFAVTALPCFSRALRSIARLDPAFDSRLVLITGTICGALKSRRYVNSLSHQMGIESDDVGRFNFRGKSLSRRANEKCVEIWRKRNQNEKPDAIARVQDLRGTDYGLGYFKPKACDYCDDVFAETADISFGDAWIPPFNERPEGTNVIVVRSVAVELMLREGMRDRELELEEITAAQARRTQESGLRHRRQGLATRLWLARTFGRWTPAKRVGPKLGSAGFVATQVVRLAVRKVTSMASIDPTGPILPVVLWPLIRAHSLLRSGSAKPQPDPPRIKATAQTLLDVRPLN